MTQARDTAGTGADPSFAANSNSISVNTSTYQVMSSGTSAQTLTDSSSARHSRTKGLHQSHSVLLSKQQSRTLDWELNNDRVVSMKQQEEKQKQKQNAETSTCVVS